MKFFIEVQLSYQHVYDVETDNEVRARELAIAQAAKDVNSSSAKFSVLNATLLCPNCKAYLDGDYQTSKFCHQCGTPRPEPDGYIPRRFEII